jgi:inner membrane transporter RhtA
MSVNPVLAALAGIIVLRQVLGLHEWAGIVIVAAANAIAMWATARRAA